MFQIVMSSDLNTANIKIDNPAEAIKDTTAGLKPFNIPWMEDKFLYLK
jgi:hypothetical protein